jgi:deoxyribodipyrimidine photo-lyase
MSATIVWFRQDLRLEDNEALDAALERGSPIVPVYIVDEASEGKWTAGDASRSWLHRSLAVLDESLRARGSRLILARGDTTTELHRIAKAVSADAINRTRRYEPAARAHDAEVAKGLSAEGVAVRDFGGSLLFEPEAVRNRQGGPFQVFTPFWRTCLANQVEPAVSAGWSRRSSRSFPAPTSWPQSLSISADRMWPGWSQPGYPRCYQEGHKSAAPWTPGELGARQRLREFVRTAIEHYDSQRDIPAVDGTSMLSPHLHFGEISPRRIWAAVAALSRDSGVFPANNGATVFLKELGWREFAYHLLWHFPHTPEQPLREAFARFSWRKDPGGRLLLAWQRGETGYPIVDAGMRQLSETGWMHNRVRMIVASFLVKHLRLPWSEGARFFWDMLVDADLANNTLGWQWSAGCGADAAPYFRIFAPVAQSRKFDADGAYIRRWLPDLANVPAAAIHAPWEDPILAGIRLGHDYPHPIVDHATARADALAAFKQLRARP